MATRHMHLGAASGKVQIIYYHWDESQAIKKQPSRYRMSAKKMLKQLGGPLTEARIRRYAASPHWRQGKFHNLVKTTLDVSLHTLPKLLYKQLCEREGRSPQKPIPIAPFDGAAWQNDEGGAKLIWYGHSAVLMRIKGKTLLIDPMFGPDAAPVAPFSSKRFSDHTLEIVDRLPPIDLALITHDHYDHLDYASIEKLHAKTKRYFVALGVGRHLAHWGVDPERIREFDWWQSASFHDISIVFTPTRHFSGRSVNDRAKSLWGGWALRHEDESVYFSGDGGYGAHFSEIGRRLGPFDLGLMECGQYHTYWHDIHMYPEESVQAAMDAGVKKAMPVHWGGFALSQHLWQEPVTRFMREAKKKGLPAITPALGEPFLLSTESAEPWWEALH